MPQNDAASALFRNQSCREMRFRLHKSIFNIPFKKQHDLIQILNLLHSAIKIGKNIRKFTVNIVLHLKKTWSMLKLHKN
jgi:hypothetical protein